MSKRRLLILTQTVLMLQASVLTVLVWTERGQYWHVAVLATVYGLAQVVDMPTRQAFVAGLMGRTHLMNALALNSVLFNAARLVGPAVAGVLIAQYGLPVAFLLNALSFMAVIGALLALRTERSPHPSAGTTILEKIRGGPQYASATPLIRFVLTLLLSVSFFVLNFNVLVPLVTKQMLHGDAGVFGWLMASLGGGAIVGTLTPSAGSLRPSGPRPRARSPAPTASCRSRCSPCYGGIAEGSHIWPQTRIAVGRNGHEALPGFELNRHHALLRLNYAPASHALNI